MRLPSQTYFIAVPPEFSAILQLSTIHVAPMADPDDSDHMFPIVDFVEDAIVTLSDAILFLTAQFRTSNGTRLRHERLNPRDDSLAVLLRQRFDLLGRR